jgi:hypothetical protein
MYHPSWYLSLPILVVTGLLQPVAVRSQSANPKHTFLVYERDGIQIAETRNGPRYLGEIFRYEHVLKLKEDESRPESLLGQVIETLMDEDGSIFVVDQAPMMPPRIVRFDPLGNYANDIGRSGQGPGEYENPRLMVVGEDRVVVFDSRLARTFFYRPNGSLIEMISVPMLRRRSSILACYPLLEGRFLLIERASNNAREGYRIESKSVTIIATGGDTLAMLTTGPVTGDFIFNQGSYAWRVFAGSPEAVYHPGSGVYLTTGLEPQIKVHDLTGRLIRIIDGGIPPERVSHTERQAVNAGLKRMLADIVQRHPQEKASFEERIRHIELNDPKAYWDDLTVDENGYLWCERPDGTYHNIVGDVSVAHEHVFRIFSPEGEFLGESRVPSRGTVSRGHFIALEDNEETGGFEVVLYRIHPDVDGLKYPN